MTANYNHK